MSDLNSLIGLPVFVGIKSADGFTAIQAKLVEVGKIHVKVELEKDKFVVIITDPSHALGSEYISVGLTSEEALFNAERWGKAKAIKERADEANKQMMSRIYKNSNINRHLKALNWKVLIGTEVFVFMRDGDISKVISAKLIDIPSSSWVVVQLENGEKRQVCFDPYLALGSKYITVGLTKEEAIKNADKWFYACNLFFGLDHSRGVNNDMVQTENATKKLREIEETIRAGGPRALKMCKRVLEMDIDLDK